ncbi:MAG: hypothetical protein HON23_06085 [Rickettsiales bacterium]|mgnify:FL=1|jgi:hypothetical protein|nr:hypothetical protein [Rickettsiales bacterium]
MTELSQQKYKWMKPFQRELYQGLCNEFSLDSLTEIGNFLGLNNPYHGAKLIFGAQKQNLYLKKLVEVKRESRSRIEDLEVSLDTLKNFKEFLDDSVRNLTYSLDSVREIKKTLEGK